MLPAGVDEYDVLIMGQCLQTRNIRQAQQDIDNLSSEIKETECAGKSKQLHPDSRDVATSKASTIEANCVSDRDREASMESGVSAIPSEVMHNAINNTWSREGSTTIVYDTNSVDESESIKICGVDYVRSETQPLLISGQGTIELQQNVFSKALVKKQSDPLPFKMMLFASNSSTGRSIELVVDDERAALQWNGTVIWASTAEYHRLQHHTHGICRYWVSFSHRRRFLKYGIGEMRQNVVIKEVHIGSEWLKTVDTVQIHVGGTNYALHIYRDGVVSEPPIAIREVNEMTLDEVASGEYTVIHNLPAECRRLYHNVCGGSFVLNGSDFPEFSEAIKESIRNPDGWCHRKLIEKQHGFGDSDKLATYLRITLGADQCNSPGIPYVLEIWPSRHYSPIHSHADSHAIIRVLHGEIEVSLFPFLSTNTCTPFLKRVFREGDVTYITPDLNQAHQLRNLSDDEPCVTIQCYQYGDDDYRHYEYFDYLRPAQDDIAHFDPSSDCSFVEFKRILKEEYRTNHS